MLDSMTQSGRLRAGRFHMAFAVLSVGRFRLAMVGCRYLRGTPRPADDVDRAAWIPVRDVFGRARPMSRRTDLVLARALLSRADRPPCCGTYPTWW